MVSKIDDPELLLKIAWLYYAKDLTQEEIAKQVGLSRPTIIRLLKLAREQGVVEFRITRPLPRAFELGFQLEQIFGPFGLREAIVVSPTNGDSTKEDVARAAALYLQQTVLPDQVLGVGWSTTLGKIPAYFTPGKNSPKSIVQLVGSVGNMPGANSIEIAVKLAQLLDVNVHHIPAPAIVEKREVRESLLQDSQTSSALEIAGKCQIGLVGIGVASSESTMIQTGLVNSDEVNLVVERGGVGDILSYCYDINGQEVQTPWQERIMAINLQQLRQIDNLIGVATGANKSLAIIGALRGGYLNTLVVDVSLAEEILRQVTEAA